METKLQKPIMEPSRVLDEDSLFLGLTYTDLIVGAVLVTQSHRILFAWGYELLSFAIGAMFFGIMAHLRLHTRKKMIQDFIGFHFIPLRKGYLKYSRKAQR